MVISMGDVVSYDILNFFYVYKPNMHIFTFQLIDNEIVAQIWENKNTPQETKLHIWQPCLSSSIMTDLFSGFTPEISAFVFDL